MIKKGKIKIGSIVKIKKVSVMSLLEQELGERYKQFTGMYAIVLHDFPDCLIVQVRPDKFEKVCMIIDNIPTDIVLYLKPDEWELVPRRLS